MGAHHPPTGTVENHVPDTVAAEQPLDPGIADVVVMLRNLGFEPTDSGDGVSKADVERDFDVKHVACTVPGIKMFSEADRLQQVLGDGWRVEASYAPQDVKNGGEQHCILLATKKEEPAPRHVPAFEEYRNALSRDAARDGEQYRANRWRAAAEELRAALEHELGRR